MHRYSFLTLTKTSLSVFTTCFSLTIWKGCQVSIWPFSWDIIFLGFSPLFRIKFAANFYFRVCFWNFSMNLESCSGISNHKERTHLVPARFPETGNRTLFPSLPTTSSLFSTFCFLWSQRLHSPGPFNSMSSLIDKVKRPKSGWYLNLHQPSLPEASYFLIAALVPSCFLYLLKSSFRSYSMSMTRETESRKTFSHSSTRNNTL